MSNNRVTVTDSLMRLGISIDDAYELRRIAMTLHRWSELECGDANGNCVERDDETGKPFMTYDRGSGPHGRYPIADREAGALKRLKAIMARYEDRGAYVQGDPRGAPLYIYRHVDLDSRGGNIESCYNSVGVAVYK